MNGWRRVADRPFVVHCPLAFRLIDDFTGGPLMGAVDASLEWQDGASWRATAIEPVRTVSGLLSYPGLGRVRDPVAQPLFRVRVRLSAEAYRPDYQATQDALEFDVPTYNDTTPPSFTLPMPATVVFLPAAHYRYPTHLRVLHGVVRDAAGLPMVDARVTADNVERTLSNESGAYSLPLRWQAPDAVVALRAEHPRSGLGNTINVALPAALATSQGIVVS